MMDLLRSLGNYNSTHGHAKIYSLDLEDNSKSRERAVAKSHISWYLTFTNKEDERLYSKSLKNLFHFPTFWAIIFIFVVFSSTQNGVGQVLDGDPFLIISFVINLLNFITLLTFTFAQFMDYFRNHLKISDEIHAYSSYVIKRFLRGHIEDSIILLLAFAQGFYQISLISRDLCVGCGKVLAIEKCLDDQERGFPISQAFYGYVSILILPVYFKSMHRHVVLVAWAILTVFLIASYIYGQYKFEAGVIVFCLFFLVSIYEFERYKMTTYLLSKEALSYEQNRLTIMQEKSKIIERKLHLALVHQILPPKVAEQIIAGKSVEPELFEEVTIFFSDVVGFTNICAAVTPIEVVRMLNDLYTVMDYCTSLFPLYKVETIGDAYMVVGGLPERCKNHAQQVADFAVLVSKAVQCVKSPVDGTPIRIRIGMHSGSVMAGVVGNLMPRYCLFGDTVNTASRMESNGEAGRIHCSGTVAGILQLGKKHVLDSRGEVPIKGKGLMHTYWLEGATENNEHSNEIAIHKTMMMVQEVLDASWRDQNRPNSMLSPRATATRGSSVDASALIDDATGTVNRGSISAHSAASEGTSGVSEVVAFGENLNTSQHSGTTRGSGIVARHSIKYNLLHRNNNGAVVPEIAFDSTGAKILVVEDSLAQRKMLLQSLHKADKSWDISYAVSGEEALQKLKAAKLQFDVIFVDENLSSNDGLFGHELVQVMRESFGMTTTVIVACTSNPQRVGQDLINAGVDLVWPKPPPGPAVMKAKIEELLISRVHTMRDEKPL